VFLLSAKAGGTGLNLTCANKLIMMEPDWNPSNDHQVMGRVWRDGQTKPVHIYRLIAVGTFEEKILQRQYMKESLSEKLVDESKNSKLFDFVSMKDLMISHSSECLTYKPNENELSEVRRWNDDFGKSECIQFVYIRKPKNNVNGCN
jgi:DNA repair and recombination protein RAD54B